MKDEDKFRPKVILLLKKPENYVGLWLSVSKAKTFEDCAAKFKYGYVEKLPRKTWSFHIFGKFAHKVLELFHGERINGNLLEDNKLMSKCFKIASAEYKTLTLEQKKEAYDILNVYLAFLINQRNNGKAPRIINVEKNFYIDIDGKILLNGMIDLEQYDPDGILHVCDYKTTKTARYLKKDFFQLLTYAFVKCVEDPTLERVRCSYIMLRHKFEFITKEFSREEIMEVQYKLLEYGDKIQAEKLYRPNPTRLCGHCDFLDKCPEGLEFLRDKTPISEFGAQDWA